MDAIKSLRTMALAATLTIGGLLAAGSTEARADGPRGGGPPVGGTFRADGSHGGPGFVYGPDRGHRVAYPGGWWRPARYPVWYRRPYPAPYPFFFPGTCPYPVPFPGTYFYGF